MHSQSTSSIITHMDLDSFFVSVSFADNQGEEIYPAALDTNAHFSTTLFAVPVKLPSSSITMI